MSDKKTGDNETDIKLAPNSNNKENSAQEFRFVLLNDYADEFNSLYKNTDDILTKTIETFFHIEGLSVNTEGNDEKNEKKVTLKLKEVYKKSQLFDNSFYHWGINALRNYEFPDDPPGSVNTYNDLVDVIEDKMNDVYTEIKPDSKDTPLDHNAIFNGFKKVIEQFDEVKIVKKPNYTEDAKKYTIYANMYFFTKLFKESIVSNNEKPKEGCENIVLTKLKGALPEGMKRCLARVKIQGSTNYNVHCHYRQCYALISNTAGNGKFCHRHVNPEEFDANTNYTPTDAVKIPRQDIKDYLQDILTKVRKKREADNVAADAGIYSRTDIDKLNELQERIVDLQEGETMYINTIQSLVETIENDSSTLRETDSHITQKITDLAKLMKDHDTAVNRHHKYE